MAQDSCTHMARVGVKGLKIITRISLYPFITERRYYYCYVLLATCGAACSIHVNRTDYGFAVYVLVDAENVSRHLRSRSAVFPRHPVHSLDASAHCLRRRINAGP